MFKNFIIFFLILITPAFSKGNIFYTVAGGAALGIYEGGLLNYNFELIKTNRKLNPGLTPGITHMTGTSAGAFNSVLSLFSECSTDNYDSFKSNFYWKGWVDLSVDDMFIKKNVKADQIFTTDGFPILGELKRQWLKGFKKDCEMVLGMAVTRFIPYEVEVNKKITVPNMTEHIVIKITGQGPGIAPKITNFRFKKGFRRQLLLPFNNDDENNFELLKTGTLASTSYPIAFPPREIPNCQKEGEEDYFPCEGKRVTKNLFIDGGVFDNSPILLSYDIANEIGSTIEDRFIWVNPHMNIYEEQLGEQEKRYDSFFDYMGAFTGNFIETSRTRDLSLVSHWHPEIKNKILNTSVSLPLMSRQLSAFIGFFERDFRIFDFYVGMVDAHLFVESLKKQNPNYPEDPNSKDWAPYYCIKKVVEGSNAFEKYCNEEKLDSNLLILLQTSITELYNDCATRKTKPLRKTFHCLEAFNKKDPPAIIKEAIGFKEWKKGKDEEILDYHFRLLNQFGYEFRDFKLRKDQSKKGQYALRNKIGEIFSTYMSKLPTSEQNTLKRAGDTFLNQKIFYTPMEDAIYITLGRALEFGWNYKRVDFIYPSYFKLSTGALLQGGYNLITGDRDVYAISPLVGFEYEFYKSNYKWQYFLGAKAGYQFSNGNGCDVPGQPNIMVECRGITILPYVGFSLLEILRFHLIYNWLPEYSFGRIRDNFLIQLGVQF